MTIFTFIIYNISEWDKIILIFYELFMEVLNDGGGNFTIQEEALYPAFHHNNTLIHLIIRGSFSKIPKYCFAKCEQLLSIDIGDNIITIDEFAFFHCSQLNYVVFPKTIESIGKLFFSETNLTNVQLPENIESINGAFDINSLTCKWQIEKLKVLNSYCIEYANKMIPTTVKIVNTRAFEHSDITTITIPENVEYVDDSAFSDCNSLSRVIIQSNNISFGDYVFSRCNSLVSIDIPDTVKGFGINCFKTIQTINYPENRNKIIPGAYSGWQGTSIVIPATIKEIGSLAFFECQNIESIIIPDSVIEIGDKVFFRSLRLSNIVIGNSVKEVKGFDSCHSLEKVIIPDNVVSIGYWAFSNCRRLKSVKIGRSVETIGINAFSFCTLLKSITLGDSVKIIKFDAFYDCPLSSLTIPSSVHTIETMSYTWMLIFEKSDCDLDLSYINMSKIKLPNDHPSDVIPLFKYFNHHFPEPEFTVPKNIKKICSYAFSGNHMQKCISQL